QELDRLAYYFDYDYADGRDVQEYTAALRRAVGGWTAQHRTARLELRDEGDRLVIEDTRPAAARPTTVLRGADRLAYLARHAGCSVGALQAELRAALGEAAPDAEQVEHWLGEWLDARLVPPEAERR